MAKENNHVVVSVITNLTDTQARTIVSDISKAKNKHAPDGRGIMVDTLIENIGNVLQTGMSKLLDR